MATRLTAFEGQILVAPYFDSNITEVAKTPEKSLGLKLRADANTELRIKPLLIGGVLLAQSYIDALYLKESKIILNPEVEFRMPLGAGFACYGQVRYFLKAFSGGSRRLQWTEISASLHHPLSARLSGWLGMHTRFSRVYTGDLYRFTGTEITLGSRYSFASHLLIEGRLTYMGISHKDYPALGLNPWKMVFSLTSYQRDHGPAGSVSIQYRGNIIAGMQGGWEHITSNSIIGAYNQSWFRGYLSGHLNPFTFYHLVFQVSRKNYRYPEYSVPRGYLDPEGPARNQLHLRLEHLFTEKSLAYLQISLLRNETIFVNRYYNKTLIELGVTRNW